MRLSSFSSGLLVLFVLGCPSPPPPIDAPLADTPPAPRPDVGPVTCVDDAECDDTLFCTGIERCRPGAAGADARGCLSPRAGGCLAGQTCLEPSDRCLTICEETSDADGDGVLAMECGGFDCDDADADRFPGHPEVCDEDGHDEDCDTSTTGAGDLDRDGAPDARCCNVRDGGLSPICGTDCDDFTARVGPGVAEDCDGLDQDCDAMVDEGVLEAGFADEDRDLHGDPARPISACAVFAGFSRLSDDCDDTRIAVHGAMVEICDGLDNDCDGDVDEEAQPVTWFRDVDGDGFGNATSGSSVSCAPLSGYSLLSSDCADDDRRRSPLAREACNGLDDDCDGLASFPVTGSDSEDDDGDGAADIRCPTFGTDCDDRDRTVHPGAPELCDHRDNDCDGAIEPSLVPADWYLDRDGDGWGDASGTVVSSCEAQPGRVARSGDCDDRDAGVAPSALDTCATGAGRDDDCDGQTDEAGGLAPAYVDGDRDGFGTGLPALVCVIPMGRAGGGGDCDDADPMRRPGTSESCAVLDGADDDCDGLVDCEDADCAGALGCGGPVRLELVSGSGQSVRLLEVTPAPIAVRVVDVATGLPVAGQRLSIRAAPGWAPSASEVLTDAGGVARVFVRAGTATGSVDVTFVASGTASLAVPVVASAPAVGHTATLLNALRASTPVVTEAASTTVPGGIGDVASGPTGELYVSDAVRHCIYRIDAAGALEVLAGRCGVPGSDGDGELAANAHLNTPVSLVVEGGRLLVADYGNRRVRAIDLTSRLIDTLAGGGLVVGPEVAATLARLSPAGLAVDGRGVVLVLDDRAPARIVELDEVSLLVREVGRPESFRRYDALFGRGRAFLATTFAPSGPGVPEPLSSYEVGANGGSRLQTSLSALPGSGVDDDGNLLAVTESGGGFVLSRVAALTHAVTPLLGGGTGTGDHVPGTSVFVGPIVGSSGLGTAVVAAEPTTIRIVWPAPAPAPALTLSTTSVAPTRLVSAWDAVEATVRLGGAGAAAAVEVVPAHGSAAVARLETRSDARGVARLELLAGPTPRTYRFLVRLRDFLGRDAMGSPAAFDLPAVAPPAGALSMWVGAETTTVSGYSTGNPSLLLRNAYDTVSAGLATAPDGSTFLVRRGDPFTGGRTELVRVDPAGIAEVVTRLSTSSVQALAHAPARGTVLVAGSERFDEVTIATGEVTTIASEYVVDVTVRPDGTFAWLPTAGAQQEVRLRVPSTGATRSIALPAHVGCAGGLEVAEATQIESDPRSGDLYLIARACAPTTSDPSSLSTLLLRVRAADDGIDVVAGDPGGTDVGGEAPTAFLLGDPYETVLAVAADGTLALTSSPMAGRSRLFRIDAARTAVTLIGGGGTPSEPLVGAAASGVKFGVADLAYFADGRLLIALHRDGPARTIPGGFESGGMVVLW